MSLLSTFNQIDVFTISRGGGHIQKHCYILHFLKYADISNLWLAVYAKLCVLIILLWSLIHVMPYACLFVGFQSPVLFVM